MLCCLEFDVVNVNGRKRYVDEGHLHTYSLAAWRTLRHILYTPTFSITPDKHLSRKVWLRRPRSTEVDMRVVCEGRTYHLREATLR
jgi:hypothetical protein